MVEEWKRANNERALIQRPRKEILQECGLVKKEKASCGQEDKPVDKENQENECGGHMAGKVTLSECAPEVSSPLRRKRIAKWRR